MRDGESDMMQGSFITKSFRAAKKAKTQTGRGIDFVEKKIRNVGEPKLLNKSERAFSRPEKIPTHYALHY